MKIIDQYRHDEQGYLPYLIGPKWQVAQLNYAPAESLERITCLDIHHLTDEAFILLEGTAVLIGARIDGSRIEFEAEAMHPGTLYNIRREVWHKIAMQPGSRVLIVEDSDTHLGDFEFYQLDDLQRRQLAEAVNEALTLNR